MAPERLVWRGTSGAVLGALILALVVGASASLKSPKPHLFILLADVSSPVESTTVDDPTPPPSIPLCFGRTVIRIAGLDLRW